MSAARGGGVVGGGSGAAAGVGDRAVFPVRRRLWLTRCGRCWSRAIRGSRSCWSTTARSRMRTGWWRSWRRGHRVVVVSQMNSGLGAARNFGISQCRGRYVFPLDADNMAHPEFRGAVRGRCWSIGPRWRTRPRGRGTCRRTGRRDPDRSATSRSATSTRALLADEDVAGDAAAVDSTPDLRRRVSLQRGADRLRGLALLP